MRYIGDVGLTIIVVLAVVVVLGWTYVNFHYIGWLP